MAYGPPQSAYTSQVPADSTTAVNTVRGSDIVCAVAGRITGLRYYYLAGTVARTLYLWHASGTSLGSAVTPGADISAGWKTGVLSTPVAVTAGQTVRVSQSFDSGGTNLPFTVGLASFTNGDLTVSAHYHDSVATGRPTTPLGVSPFVDVVFEALAADPLTITAVHDPANARIRLHVTGAADGPATIQRLDSNGTAYVRLFEGQVPLAGELLVDDYEAALSGDITYLVTDSGANTATVHLTIATTPSTDGPWLTHPNLPALNTRIKIVSDDPRWQHRSTEHNVYGRAAPLFTTQPMKSRSGTLVLLADSWDEVRVIHAVYERGDPVLLRNPCLTDADYYHIGDVSTTPLAQSHWFGPWYVTVDYQSVDAPAGATAGPWTWDDVVAGYDTWLDVITDVPTWADLTLGPVS